MTVVGVWPVVAGLDDIARSSPDFAPAAARATALVNLFQPPGGTPTRNGAGGEGGVNGAEPLNVTQAWDSAQSPGQLHAWLLRQRPGGLALAHLPAPSPTPGASQAPFDADDVHWVVPADPHAGEGLVTAHVDAAQSGSRLEVMLTQAWVDSVPARFQGRPGQPQYAVTDVQACPRMPSRPWLRLPAIDGEPPEEVEGAVNSGYDVARHLLPDTVPTGALRCTYAYSTTSRNVDRTASSERRLGPADAAVLARRLSGLPTAALHQDSFLSYRQDLDSTGYVIFTYDGRGPATLSYLGNGITNGDLLLLSPAAGTMSPLYPHGTAGIDDVFRWR